jgi:hypothetical protein
VEDEEEDEEEKRSVGPAFIQISNKRYTASYGSIYEVRIGRW